MSSRLVATVASAALAPATTRHSISCRFGMAFLPRQRMECHYPATRTAETVADAVALQARRKATTLIAMSASAHAISPNHHVPNWW